MFVNRGSHKKEGKQIKQPIDWIEWACFAFSAHGCGSRSVECRTAKREEAEADDRERVGGGGF